MGRFLVRPWKQRLDHVLLWAQFAGAGALVVAAGVRLTANADRLAERFRLGKAFVGFILVGWATSLPELVLSVGSSVRGLPGLAAGNIFGSCTFNLGIIALYDLVQGRGALLSLAGPGLKLCGFLSAGMIALGAWGLLLGPTVVAANVSWVSLAIFGLYVLSVLVLYLNDRRGRAQLERQAPEVTRREAPPPRRVAMSIAATVVIILLAGVWLTGLGKQVATRYSLSQSFVGAVFLAITSSLPELVTGIAAIKMGLYGMAIGSIFGSNIFNLAILALADFARGGGSLFEQVKASNQTAALLVSAAAGITMTLTAILGIRLRRNKSFLGLGWDVIAMLAIYVVGAVAMTLVGAAAGAQ